MNKKRVIGIGIVILICGVIIVTGKLTVEKDRAIVYNSQKEKIAEITYENEKIQYKCDDIYDSYVDLVCQEAVQIVQKNEASKKKDAEKKIVKENMQIYTELDDQLLKNIEKAAKEDSKIAGDDFATAITDVKGTLIASYGRGKEKKNYVDTTTYAGSAIKPLSVYGPGIEANKITWSSMYEDSPYMQIKDERGNMKDWPGNTKEYRYQPITVEQALKESNNAVAVKVLKECGVEAATRFINDKLHIKVEKEKELLQSEGEDSVLSNIALGYLEDGITLKEMLEAYQCFANGGYWYNVHCIHDIAVQNQMYYRYEGQSGEKVFSEETAYVMNRLLNNVVSENGTGADAAIEGVDICGKTGTSKNFKDNWFAGMTPEYVCVTWYSEVEKENHIRNESPALFREIIEQLELDLSKEYPACDDVVSLTYCMRTGKIAGDYCTDTGVGYYNKDAIPEKCNCK